MVVAARDILRWVESDGYDAIVVGKLWFNLHLDSLQLAQVVVQRYVHPALWDPAIVWVLLLPAWLAFAVPGLALSILCRKRRRRSA